MCGYFWPFNIFIMFIFILIGNLNEILHRGLVDLHSNQLQVSVIVRHGIACINCLVIPLNVIAFRANTTSF